MVRGTGGLRTWLLLVLLATAPRVTSAQVIGGSCWGNCTENDQITGCSCDSYCETRGDCCADKDVLCYAQPAWPLCALVDYDTDAAVWGTDLGWSYEHRGKNELLFGDTWSVDTQPLCSGSQSVNDDAMATLPLTRPSWLPTTPTATTVSCPAPTFQKSDANSFRPVTVSIGGVNHPMGAFITPATAWSDGTRAFTWVTSQQPLACNIWVNPCPEGTLCEDPWLTPCFPNCNQVCFDPTSPLDFKYLFSAEVAYRPNESTPTAYVSGHTFYTNKFTYPTAVTVAAFDPNTPANSDYANGYGTLLLFGRPSSYDSAGQALVYLAYQHLDELVPSGGAVAWRPNYFAGTDASGNPTWSTSVADAMPLNPYEFNFPGFSDVAFVEPLGKWVMLYGGDIDALADSTQARKGAIHVRIADHPWGPWTPGVPLLLREVTAPYMGCDAPGTTYGTGPWRLDGDPFLLGYWQANCQTSYRNCGPSGPLGGVAPGHMYAPNLIESWTYDASSPVYPRAAQIYFTVSAGSPYQVMLASARLELPPDPKVTFGRWIHLRAYDNQLVAASGSTATTSRQPDNSITHLRVLDAANPSAPGEVRNGSRVLLQAKNGRYLRRRGDRLAFETTPVADSEWIVERLAGTGTVQLDDDVIRLLSATANRRLKLKSAGLRAFDGAGTTANFRLTWGCQAQDDCDPAR